MLSLPELLDSTRRTCSSSSPTGPTASEAADDDVEEGDDGVNYGSKDGANTVDDGHKAGTNRLEDAFDLKRGASCQLAVPWSSATKGSSRKNLRKKLGLPF